MLDRFLPNVALPQPLLALLRRELVESLGLISAQEGVMVVIEALGIIVDLVAELGLVVDSVLLLRGLGGDAEHGQRQAQQELRDAHGGSKAPAGQGRSRTSLREDKGGFWHQNGQR